MKLLCDGLDLCEAVNKVIKAINPKAVMPILEGIKLEAIGGLLILTATDNEFTIIKKIKAEISREGETVVAGKLFADFIRKLNNERIELEFGSGNNLRIIYGENQGVISCFDVSEFPRVQNVESTEHFSIVKKEFKDIINKVGFCTGRDDDRVIFQGVNMEIDEYTLNAVAIDGTRLAQSYKPIEQKTALMSMIIPTRSIHEISKLIEDSEEIITIYRQKNVIMADLGHTKIISRLIEGEFINYKYIYPQGINTTIKISRERFQAALDRASVVARKDTNKEVRFEIRENIMTISSDSEEGKVNETVAVALEGKDLNIAFNASYFIDVLNVLKDDYIKVEFLDEISPCVIRPIKTDEYSYLILPTRPR